ncbi:MAG: hypothetical protein K1X53_17500 [Candidatus Sumerlaeaceae bacterium]|nr:hypothetical protein [Candidatus Sumerlaeaceae bacterium]
MARRTKRSERTAGEATAPAAVAEAKASQVAGGGAMRGLLDPLLRPPRLVAAIFSAIVLLTAFVVLYGPAITLPVSLVDDMVVMQNSDKLWTNLATKPIAEALREDFSVRARSANPGVSFKNMFWQRLSGGKPAVLHGIRLAGFALLIAILSGAAFMFARTGAWGKGLAACATGLLLMGAEVTGWHNFQCLRANWYRLHAADATLAVLAAVHWLVLWLALRARGGMRRGLLFAASGALLLVMTTVKPSAIAFLGPPWVLAALLWLGGNRGWRGTALMALAGAAVVGGYLFSLKRFMAASPVMHDYGADYAPTLAAFQNGWEFHRVSWWDALGPLSLVLPVSFLLRNVTDLAEGGRFRHVLRRETPILFFAAAWACATAVYLPWPHLLPRYMLTPLLGLSVAAGIELASLLARNREWIAIPAIATGAACMLAPTMNWFWWGVVAATAVSIWQPLRGMGFGFLSGAALVGVVYFLTALPLTHRSLQDSCVANERTQGQVLAKVTEWVHSGKNVGFVGGVGDERIGSLAGLAARDNPTSGILKPTLSPEEARDCVAVLIHEEMSPRELLSKFGGMPLKEYVEAPRTTIRPLNFWEWRQRYWTTGQRSLGIEAALRNRWAVFEPQ